MIVVDYVEAKFTCDGKTHKIKFKAGKLGDKDRPGVCVLIVSLAKMNQLKEKGFFESVKIERFPDVRSLTARHSNLILESCELPKTEDQNSGDGLCFEDHRGRWVCLGS